MLIVRGTKKLRDRVRGATPAGADDESTTVLHRHGVTDDVVAAERAAMSEVRLAPTNNRSVVGVMNEFADFGERCFSTGMNDLEELSMRVSQLIVGPLMKRTGSPDRELAAVLGLESGAQTPSNVIPFPGSYRPDASPASDPRPLAFGSLYQLKVTIQHIKPPVWRRVLVDGSSTLDQVHEVIQAAFGWWNYHLHEFEVDCQRFGMPDPDDDDWGLPTIDEQFVPLASVAIAEGATLDYTYDFGDGWDHKIVVEKILPAAGVAVPACIGGRRACPPEDCGGPWGYQELLAFLADPTHPEHRERAEWIGGPIDPEAFDPADFERNLEQARAVTFDI